MTTRFNLDTGYTDLFMLFRGTSVAVPLTEGTSLDIGWYSYDPQDLIDASLAANTSPGYDGVVLHGDYAQPEDYVGQTPEFAFSGFRWDGTTEVDYLDAPVSEAGAGSTVSAALVDKDHTWSFDSPNQVIAPNTITEIVGFNGLLQMDFTLPIPSAGSIASITTTSVADVGGATEPTISSSALSADKKKVLLTVDASSATAGTYTFSVKILTTDSQTIARKGRLTLQ